MKIAIGALFLVAACDAHVRLKYAGFNIRNANGPEASGAYSTNGPCGGAAFGKNGVNEVKVGDEIKMTIAYNGGHQSASNLFKVGFSCGEGGSQDLFRKRNNTMAGTTPEEHPAADSLTSGYDFTFKIPNSASGMECTSSAVDQRDWGGCYDFKVEATASPTPVPGPTPPPTSGLYGKDLTGYLSIPSTGKCIMDATNCCCLHGTANVAHTSGASSAKLTVNLGCHASSLPLPENVTMPALSGTTVATTIDLTQKTPTSKSLSATVTVADQKFEVNVYKNPPLIEMANVDPTPVLCSLSQPLIAGVITPDVASASTVSVGLATAFSMVWALF